MLRISILSLTFILTNQATLIPSLPPWSAYKYAKQNNIQNILKTQSFPHYTCSPLTMVSPTLAHSLAVHRTQKGDSSQSGIEKSSKSGEVPIERFGTIEKMSRKIGWRNGIGSQKMNSNFREFRGVPGLG